MSLSKNVSWGIFFSGFSKESDGGAKRHTVLPHCIQLFDHIFHKNYASIKNLSRSILPDQIITWWSQHA
jgi:hypothetical protein